MRDIVITADDFGMSHEVNEAVERAHKDGVLTAASLVVTGAAASDAVERARRMPRLGVGLHLALLHALPACDPKSIPALMEAGGPGLGAHPGRLGTAMSLSTVVRRQARAEIVRQFELYRATGLPLDHVDGHLHFHQHPWIVRLLAELAPSFGIRAVRIPYEPALASWQASRDRLSRRVGNALAHRPLAAWMRLVLGRAGVLVNDRFFGMVDGGEMSGELLVRLIRSCRPGITEIGLHPAAARWDGPFAPPCHWRVERELEALLDPAVASALRAPGRRSTTFGQIASRRKAHAPVR